MNDSKIIEEVSFNINQYVKVKLTDKGRQILRDNHVRLYKDSKIYKTYIPPEEDDNGWSMWQLWYLMTELGGHICMGRKPPFETNIIICRGEIK